MILVTPSLRREPQLFVNWLSIPIYGALGYLGMRYFLRRAGFKGMLDSGKGTSKYVLPVVLGTAFAGGAIVFDLISRDRVPQLPFPISIPAYVPVAIMDNMFWKLFLLTLVIFLISGKLMKGRHQEKVFWSASIVYALLYMMIQFGQYSSLVGNITFLTVFQIISVSGGFILVSCWMFRRYGFLAPVLMHLAQYIIYHGLYGGFS
jgi:hypothetical protein